MKEEKNYYVYIMTNNRKGTLYVGVTNDLLRRVYEHKNELIPGFTKTYHLHTLVYFEQTEDIDAVLYREKQLKWWRRQWKLNLINNSNPEWKDLWDEIYGTDIIPELTIQSLPRLDSSIKLE